LASSGLHTLLGGDGPLLKAWPGSKTKASPHHFKRIRALNRVGLGPNWIMHGWLPPATVQRGNETKHDKDALLAGEKLLLKAQVAQARANPRCLEMASDPKAHPPESEPGSATHHTDARVLIPHFCANANRTTAIRVHCLWACSRCLPDACWQASMDSSCDSNGAGGDSKL